MYSLPLTEYYETLYHWLKWTLYTYLTGSLALTEHYWSLYELLKWTLYHLLNWILPLIKLDSTTHVRPGRDCTEHRSTYWTGLLTIYWTGLFTTYWTGLFITYRTGLFTTCWTGVFTTYWNGPFTTYWTGFFSTYWILLDSLPLTEMDSLPLTEMDSTSYRTGLYHSRQARPRLRLTPIHLLNGTLYHLLDWTLWFKQSLFAFMKIWTIKIIVWALNKLGL